MKRYQSKQIKEEQLKEEKLEEGVQLHTLPDFINMIIYYFNDFDDAMYGENATRDIKVHPMADQIQKDTKKIKNQIMNLTKYDTGEAFWFRNSYN